MNTMFSLSDRLREMAERQSQQGVGRFEAPGVDEWLRYWNDDESELGNLRNLEYWLDRRRA